MKFKHFKNGKLFIWSLLVSVKFHDHQEDHLNLIYCLCHQIRPLDIYFSNTEACLKDLMNIDFTKKERNYFQNSLTESTACIVKEILLAYENDI